MSSFHCTTAPVILIRKAVASDWHSRRTRLRVLSVCNMITTAQPFQNIATLLYRGKRARKATRQSISGTTRGSFLSLSALFPARSLAPGIVTGFLLSLSHNGSCIGGQRSIRPVVDSAGQMSPRAPGNV